MMLEKLLWLIRRGLIPASIPQSAPQRPPSLLQPGPIPVSPLKRHCFQELPVRDGFMRVVGCNRRYAADSRNTRIYIVTVVPQITCIYEKCPHCRLVIFRFHPLPSDMEQLEAHGINRTDLNIPPPDFVLAYRVAQGDWPDSFHPLGDKVLTVADLPPQLRFDPATGQTES